MIFWALEQRRKRAQEREAATQARVAAARAEAWAEVQAETQSATRTETLTRLLSNLLSAGIVKPSQDLEQWAQQNGIELHQLPHYRAARAYQLRRERRAQRRQSAE